MKSDGGGGEQVDNESSVAGETPFGADSGLLNVRGQVVQQQWDQPVPSVHHADDHQTERSNERCDQTRSRFGTLDVKLVDALLDRIVIQPVSCNLYDEHEANEDQASVTCDSKLKEKKFHR